MKRMYYIYLYVYTYVLFSYYSFSLFENVQTYKAIVTLKISQLALKNNK